MSDIKRIHRNRSFIVNLKGASGGFTFLELMIALAIFVALTAMAVPTIRSLVEESSGNRAVKELISDLHVARSLAIRFHRNAQVDFDFPANQYTISWNGNAQSRVVDISAFRNGVQFEDNPPAPSPPAVNQIIFNGQGFATTSGNLYITEDINQVNPEMIRIEVSYAGAISEMHWIAGDLRWIYK